MRGSIILPIVIVESPFAGSREVQERNRKYLARAMRDCILRGEAPFAGHGLYTTPGCLRDEVEEERRTGIAVAETFRRYAKKTVVYADLGITKGMEAGIEAAQQLDQRIEYRWIDRSLPDPPPPPETKASLT